MCVCISCDGGSSGVEMLYLGLSVLVLHVTIFFPKTDSIVLLVYLIVSYRDILDVKSL